MTTENNGKILTVGDLAIQLKADFDGDSAQNEACDVTHDSRQIREGWIFAAIKGFASDGHQFVDEVLRRGAVGIISEQPKPADFHGAWLKVGNARAALAQAANFLNGEPSRRLKLVGVTGTNGKTTTVYLVNALATAAGEKTAMLTTVEYRIGERSEPAVRTTPEASDTNRFLRAALDENCTVAAMETSSQALDLRRCDDLQFACAIFTNLTRDHLDYHTTMESYFDAKKMLFDGRTGSFPQTSVINLDDAFGIKLAEEMREKGQKIITFAQDRQDADLTAENVEISLLKGTSFTLKYKGETYNLTSPLVGKPHVYNILSATAAVLALGLPLAKIIEGIAVCKGAPGRFERVAHDGDFAVVVDYAHTDDALLNTLKTARRLTGGRVITVFGCGGDRDRSKRAPMGEIAGLNSDLVVITSDNPRTENPLEIIEQIEKGIEATNCPYLKIPDRREAIQTAIDKAKSGDVVIIAGKGHENYQIIGADKFHFDDREEASDAVRQKMAAM